MNNLTSSSTNLPSFSQLSNSTSTPLNFTSLSSQDNQTFQHTFSSNSSNPNVATQGTLPPITVIQFPQNPAGTSSHTSLFQSQADPHVESITDGSESSDLIQIRKYANSFRRLRGSQLVSNEFEKPKHKKTYKKDDVLTTVSFHISKDARSIIAVPVLNKIFNLHAEATPALQNLNGDQRLQFVNRLFTMRTIMKRFRASTTPAIDGAVTLYQLLSLSEKTNIVIETFNRIALLCRIFHLAQPMQVLCLSPLEIKYIYRGVIKEELIRKVMLHKHILFFSGLSLKAFLSPVQLDSMINPSFSNVELLALPFPIPLEFFSIATYASDDPQYTEAHMK